MSAAVLAEKLEAALAVLPALNDRLDELTERQARLRRGGRTVQGNSSSPLHSQQRASAAQQAAATAVSQDKSAAAFSGPRWQRKARKDPGGRRAAWKGEQLGSRV